jgi:hypothetical protein
VGGGDKVAAGCIRRGDAEHRCRRRQWLGGGVVYITIDRAAGVITMRVARRGRGHSEEEDGSVVGFSAFGGGGVDD